MSADTITPEQAAEQAPQAAAEQTRQEIFKFSEYVHVGDGAAECEHGTDGKCQDPDHFHAWCRLPNPFQVRDISEKARAARARMLRMLRDTNSDAHVILEQELDVLREEGSREVLIEEILDRDFPQNYNDAITAVLDMDDPSFVPENDDDEVPKLYANIDQDREEYQRQLVLPEEQRGEDFGELEKTVAAYSNAVEAELASILTPRREQMAERTMDDLVDIVRQDRIEHAGNETYLHTFNTWQWYVCTYKPKKGQPNERVWSDVTQFKYEAPSEVISAVQETFSDLETRLARSRAAKNS